MVNAKTWPVSERKSLNPLPFGEQRILKLARQMDLMELNA